MTSKLHTKPTFNATSNNIDSKFTTHITAIGKHSLLSILLTFFTLIASTKTAQAELVDLSNPEPVIQFSTQDASWLKQPEFYFREGSLRCSDSVTGEPIRVRSGQILEVTLSLLVDEQGSITHVNVRESSGNRCFDRKATRQVKTGIMKPFFIKGKKVTGRVTLPIKFKVP
ncbi:energy transducer TonB [Psychrobacter sp. JB385]|uniref:energy transducer TonB family protein n=1 Tax=Psychrobacter sp. JB385 TaxID=1434841 RepID=UPI000B35C10C|nr:energy transducer TonB [Psychrobacter sp. JB385]